MNEPTKPDDPSADEMPEEQLDQVSGGVRVLEPKKPVPGGPVPIPYPNFSDTTTKL